MADRWERFIARVDKALPETSTRRKLVQIVAVILLFEGLSVLILFSKAGLPAGIFSLALGLFLLIVLHPQKTAPEKPAAKVVPVEPREDPPGVKLIDWLMKKAGSDYVVIVIGSAIVAGVLVFNFLFSGRPEIGDLDTLTIMLGVMIVAYPFLVPKFKVEAMFTLLFIALVVLFLVVPQAVGSLSEETGSTIGNSYVEYMLAAPFASVLNLIGIPASSHGSVVIITFQDGTVQALGISAYCAGLYSFSIFLAAFFSFVLVFERLPVKILAIVLALGLLIAYLGNLFRMVIIGIVGYYEGLDALLWAHENVGWIIFLSWSALFWYFLLGYVSRRSASSRRSTEDN